jgi:hypothetical protein
MNPVHTLISYFLNMNINIILTNVSSSFQIKIMYEFLISPTHTICPICSILLDIMTLTNIC